MADNYASAVRAGTMAAGRMLRDLGVRELVESSGEPVDVFGAIYQLGLPLMLWFLVVAVTLTPLIWPF